MEIVLPVQNQCGESRRILQAFSASDGCFDAIPVSFDRDRDKAKAKTAGGFAVNQAAVSRMFASG